MKYLTLIQVLKPPFKILAAILLALILIVLVSSAAIYIMDVPNYRAMQSVMVPTFIAGIGFALYGVQGTLWWWVTQIALKRWLPKLGYQNLISATLSSVLSCLTLPIIMLDFGPNVLMNALAMVMAVLPVALVAVWVHWMLTK